MYMRGSSTTALTYLLCVVKVDAPFEQNKKKRCDLLDECLGDIEGKVTIPQCIADLIETLRKPDYKVPSPAKEPKQLPQDSVIGV